ncbi:MAG: NifB/NifX family molybdenum-iron cluster-binding protein [Desulfovibrio sp.]|nr:NifB/NifX family molybdenum-iron cluster-binding protein [Desulfovibrio sp.]
MKIAVSSEGPGLESQVDPRFGRAAGFVIVDMENMNTEYADNGASQVMAQGAGIQTAERLSALGVSAVLSGYVGPKAFTALQAAGMQVYQDMDCRSVGEAVRCYSLGTLIPASAPNK